MAIVLAQHRKTKDEVKDMLANMQEIDINAEVLLMIDYAFHNTDEDYDEGLSFLDRLYSKLRIYFPIQWNVRNLKKFVNDSNNPAQMLIDILNEILTDDMIALYGV